MNNTDITYAQMITDRRIHDVTSHAAIGAAEDRGDRVYVALWADGDRTFFAVNGIGTARIYAREYGMRFRSGDRPLRVMWSR